MNPRATAVLLFLLLLCAGCCSDAMQISSACQQGQQDCTRSTTLLQKVDRTFVSMMMQQLTSVVRGPILCTFISLPLFRNLQYSHIYSRHWLGHYVRNAHPGRVWPRGREGPFGQVQQGVAQQGPLLCPEGRRGVCLFVCILTEFVKLSIFFHYTHRPLSLTLLSRDSGLRRPRCTQRS